MSRPPSREVDGPGCILSDPWHGSVARESILAEVEEEAARGLAKFPKALGYPDGTRAGGMNLVQRDQAKLGCDRAERAGACTWAYVLAEEFWEAMCEEDPEKLRAELIQVAAVAANWVAFIDARPRTSLHPVSVVIVSGFDEEGKKTHEERIVRPSGRQLSYECAKVPDGVQVTVRFVKE